MFVTYKTILGVVLCITINNFITVYNLKWLKSYRNEEVYNAIENSKFFFGWLQLAGYTIADQKLWSLLLILIFFVT